MGRELALIDKGKHYRNCLLVDLDLPISPCQEDGFMGQLTVAVYAQMLRCTLQLKPQDLTSSEHDFPETRPLLTWRLSTYL